MHFARQRNTNLVILGVEGWGSEFGSDVLFVPLKLYRKCRFLPLNYTYSLHGRHGK